MNEENLAAERFSQLEKEVTDVIEGRISIDALSFSHAKHPGKKLDDFARDIKDGKVPASYTEKTRELSEKLLAYCRTRREATN